MLRGNFISGITVIELVEMQTFYLRVWQSISQSKAMRILERG